MSKLSTKQRRARARRNAGVAVARRQHFAPWPATWCPEYRVEGITSSSRVEQARRLLETVERMLGGVRYVAGPAINIGFTAGQPHWAYRLTAGEVLESFHPRVGGSYWKAECHGGTPITPARFEEVVASLQQELADADRAWRIVAAAKAARVETIRCALETCPELAAELRAIVREAGQQLVGLVLQAKRLENWKLAPFDRLTVEALGVLMR